MKPTLPTLHLPKRCLSTNSPKVHLSQPKPPLLRTTVPGHKPGRQSRLPPTITTTISLPTFSTRATPLSISSRDPASPAKPGSAKTRAHNHEQVDADAEGQAPSFSFEGLGISRNMKIVLLVILGGFGSIETYFWCRAIWTWWVGGEEGGTRE